MNASARARQEKYAEDLRSLADRFNTESSIAEKQNIGSNLGIMNSTQNAFI
jgi:hypothetical protein